MDQITIGLVGAALGAAATIAASRLQARAAASEQKLSLRLELAKRRLLSFDEACSALQDLCHAHKLDEVQTRSAIHKLIAEAYLVASPADRDVIRILSLQLLDAYRDMIVAHYDELCRPTPGIAVRKRRNRMEFRLQDLCNAVDRAAERRVDYRASRRSLEDVLGCKEQVDQWRRSLPDISHYWDREFSKLIEPLGPWRGSSLEEVMRRTYAVLTAMDAAIMPEDADSRPIPLTQREQVECERIEKEARALLGDDAIGCLDSPSARPRDERVEAWERLSLILDLLKARVSS